MYKKLTRFVASKTFFIATLCLFTLGALWLAFSSRYPMAFDENYHLGLIKLHALQWNPLFSSQPGGVAEYGAITRDPSYIFHYLMSLPYRALVQLSFNENQIIVFLRLMNVALFSYSVVLFRRLLAKTTARPAIINSAFFFFLMVPVVPFLAATINYDNLQNVLLAHSLLLLVRFRERMLKKQFDLSAFIGVCSIGLLGSLVKFTFLPFLTAFAAYFIYAVIRYHRGSLKAIKKSWLKTSRVKQYLLAATFVFSVGLFVNTYAINIVRYHNPIPQCGQVLDVQRCSAYSPWYRNWLAAQNNKGVDPNPIKYTGVWIGGMYNRLYFVINGKAPVDNYQNFMAPFLALSVILLGAAGFVLSLFYGYKILRRDPVLLIMLFISLVYVASVWGRNYHDYLQLGKAVAINGRYLIPILPFVFLLFAMSYQKILAGRQKAVAWLCGLSFLLYMQGGGITSFIYYSSDSWYWDGNTTVQHMNHAAKRVVEPFFVTHYLTALDHLYQ